MISATFVLGVLQVLKRQIRWRKNCVGITVGLDMTMHPIKEDIRAAFLRAQRSSSVL